MATGRAVITTDTQGCRETVREGVNGFLAPVKNTAELADKMTLFLKSPAVIPRMGEASWQYAEEKYDVVKVKCCNLFPLGVVIR